MKIQAYLEQTQLVAGIILNLEANIVRVALLADGRSVYQDQKVFRTSSLLIIPTELELFGRIVDDNGSIELTGEADLAFVAFLTFLVLLLDTNLKNLFNLEF